ncbi:hypothetical protein M5K25_004700 [Dendrobium thyrsiflorum]|uniref:Uncharacterized protein n=1 Tax=Dendrobium thyrsiflorum TaxID=117978 RepID=A0ABD0VGC7_DENTH
MKKILRDPSVLYAGVDFCDCSYTRHLGIELSAWGQLFGSSVPCFPVLLTVVYWEQLCWAAVPRTALGGWLFSRVCLLAFPLPCAVVSRENLMAETILYIVADLWEEKVGFLGIYGAFWSSLLRDPSVLYAGVDFCDCSYTRHLGIELSAWGQLFGSSVPCFPVLLTVVYWEQLCWAAVPRTALGGWLFSRVCLLAFPLPCAVVSRENLMAETILYIVADLWEEKRDFGLVYDEQDYVQILQSIFFDVDPETDHTIQGYIARILDTLVLTDEDQLGTAQWHLASDPPQG